MKATILTLLLILALPVTSHQEPEEAELICRVAPDIIKRAHRYHGILYSEQGQDGQWVFVRDGWRCKLFTEDFLKETIK